MLLLLGLILVAWTSLVPIDQVPARAPVSDKVGHLVAYLLLGLVAVAAQRRPRPVLTGLGLVLFGLVIEILQGRWGYRSFEWADLVADAVGVVVGILIALFVRSRLARRGEE